MQKYLYLFILVCFTVACSPNYLEKDNEAEIQEMIMDFYIKYGIEDYNPTYFSGPIGKRTINDSNGNKTSIKYSIGHKFRGYSQSGSLMFGIDVWYVTITKDKISIFSKNHSADKVLEVLAK